MHETNFFIPPSCNQRKLLFIHTKYRCFLLSCDSPLYLFTYNNKDVPTSQPPRPSFFKPNNSYQNSPNKMVPPPPPPPPYKPSPSSQRPPFQGALPDVLSRPNENHHSTFLQSRGDYTLHTLKIGWFEKVATKRHKKLNQIESTKKIPRTSTFKISLFEKALFSPLFFFYFFPISYQSCEKYLSLNHYRLSFVICTL